MRRGRRRLRFYEEIVVGEKKVINLTSEKVAIIIPKELLKKDTLVCGNSYLFIFVNYTQLFKNLPRIQTLGVRKIIKISSTSWGIILDKSSNLKPGDRGLLIALRRRYVTKKDIFEVAKGLEGEVDVLDKIVEELRKQKKLIYIDSKKRRNY